MLFEFIFTHFRSRLVLGLVPVLALTLSGATVELIPRGSNWSWWKGTNDPVSAEGWRLKTFDDRAWSRGAAPFHYGEGVATGTELADMRNNYSAVYLRRPFRLDAPADVAVLHLGVAADDGFIAWINGREVARFNLPDGPVSRSTLAVGAATEPVPFDQFTVTHAPGLLEQGTNILAIMGFNISLGGSSDFFLDVALAAEFDSNAPRIIETIPVPGVRVRDLSTVELHFSERVTGLDAADLLINRVPAERVEETAPGHFVFSFAPPGEGLVTLAWRDGHGITDLANPPLPFAGASWTYQLDPNITVPGVVISEFMADNDRTLNDEDGDSSDWIELHNSNEDAVDLTGWFLSDDPAVPTKWRFPAISIKGQGYLLVFASEKDRTNATARLHTNFRLSPSGEFLSLFDPRTNVISAFSPAFPPQEKDVSYGRLVGTRGTGYFSKPTPGSANSSGGVGFAAAVEFSRSSSTFFNPLHLILSSAGTNTSIRYTLNGAAPTQESALYTAPVPITNSVLVRARAYAPGLLPGPIRSEGFVLLGRDVLAFTSDLPVLILHTAGQGTISASRQTPAHISLFEPINGVTSITNKPSFHTRGALRVRGSSTEGLPKSSWAMEFWDEANLDRNLPILDFPADSDWVLYAPNSFEPSLLHNPFMHSLSKDIGRYSPRTRFVEVFVSHGFTPGPIASNRYNGIYVLEEKISIGRHRVAIDKLEPEHLNAPEVQGGYLLKIDRLDPGDAGFSGAGINMGFVDPKEREIGLPSRAAQRNYIRSYFTAFGQALNDRTLFNDPLRGYAAYIDTGSWIDFHWLNTLSANPDGFRLSTYLHKPRFGGITFGPIWDFDRTLGSTDGRDMNPRLWGGGGSDFFFNFTWWGTLFRDADFFQRYIDRYHELRRGEFSTAALHARVDRLAGEVRQAQPRERARWRITPRGGSYDAEIARLRAWLSNRVDFFDAQFVRPPLLSRAGGSVAPGFELTLSNPTNTPIYYTLDGTDPRLPRGVPSPAARIYEGPLRLSTNARVTARVFNSNHRPRTGAGGPLTNSPWSGPVTATFVVTPITLSISEIMFHPAEDSRGSLSPRDDLQFMELKNTGTAPVNLAGISLESDVRFQFPTNTLLLAPGSRLLVVKDKSVFASTYPTVDPSIIVGNFSGSLSHGGGRLFLRGPLQEPILDLEYKDSWQPLADGFGFSLVLRDETVPVPKLNDPASWRLSARIGGSPGAADPPPPVLPIVLINEASTHSDPGRRDYVELFNPGPAAVDVSHWYLTDEFRRPKLYRFPVGSVIPAGGFLTTVEGDWFSGANPLFSLNSAGDQVYLFSANAGGQLTGWFHGFEFGSIPPNVTFGRYQASQGREYFLPQSRPSPGATNAGPAGSPIVVAQLLFHPPDAGFANNTLQEFVLLRNLADRAVPLSDPDRSHASWRLRGEVEFDFPARAQLAAAGSVMIVSFDPLEQSGALAGLRARFNVPLSIPIVGPWTGRLNNAGGEVRLLRPGTANPDDDARLAFDIAETVPYQPVSPWPTGASGTGRALVRAKLDGPSVDPIHWTSAIPFQPSPDADRDELPDDWEVLHSFSSNSALGNDGPGGDPDRDGQSNLQEYRAGTDPRSAASLLQIRQVRLLADRVMLSFPSVAGRTYWIQYRDAWDESPWITLLRGATSYAGEELSIEDPRGGQTTRYYRLTLP